MGDRRQLEIKLNEEGYTYVFETKGEAGAKPPTKFRRKIWQIVPSVCATLMVLPYGIMLGWPSPTYPRLVKLSTPIGITMDQSAMVAGFLMIGNTAGTPFSTFRRLGPKYGIILGVTVMTLGWVMMWQAKDIYYLLGSRILVGAGHGFGFGQVVFYISEICQDSLARQLTRLINLYVFSGVVLAFAYGPFVSFRSFSIIASVISLLVLFLTIFLPSTPRELVKSGKHEEAKKLIGFLSPHLDISEEMKRIKERINLVERDLTFCDIVKKSSLRKNLLVFVLLVWFQQFSGAPATIIYSQMIMTASGCPRPELCALLYAFAFFLANVYGVFCTPFHDKQKMLIFSSVGASLLILVKIIVVVEKVNETLWNFTSLLVLLVFIMVHTVGLGSVPVSLIPDLFPKEAKRVVTKTFVMLHCMFGLFITKIFQVMFDRLGLYAPLCLFLVISTFSIIFVINFVPSSSKAEDT